MQEALSSLLPGVLPAARCRAPAADGAAPYCLDDLETMLRTVEMDRARRTGWGRGIVLLAGTDRPAERCVVIDVDVPDGRFACCERGERLRGCVRCIVVVVKDARRERPIFGDLRGVFGPIPVAPVATDELSADPRHKKVVLAARPAVSAIDVEHAVEALGVEVAVRHGDSPSVLLVTKAPSDISVYRRPPACKRTPRLCQ